jgi:hypothetical protein
MIDFVLTLASVLEPRVEGIHYLANGVSLSWAWSSEVSRQFTM